MTTGVGDRRATDGHPPRADQLRGATARAVKTFRREHRLNADGVAGPATWQRLLTAG
ncbi:peptidoglycan-binding protein [Streptomyces hydrogenans]|uniref:peptidoglycan-binding domain-containing protein n=1 Tax=Streptomyces hydrogenans TaxID=1873719 RepID=UPI00381B2CAE